MAKKRKGNTAEALRKLMGKQPVTKLNKPPKPKAVGAGARGGGGGGGGAKSGGKSGSSGGGRSTGSTARGRPPGGGKGRSPKGRGLTRTSNDTGGGGGSKSARKRDRAKAAAGRNPNMTPEDEEYFKNAQKEGKMPTPVTTPEDDEYFKNAEQSRKQGAGRTRGGPPGQPEDIPPIDTDPFSPRQSAPASAPSDQVYPEHIPMSTKRKRASGIGKDKRAELPTAAPAPVPGSTEAELAAVQGAMGTPKPEDIDMLMTNPQKTIGPFIDAFGEANVPPEVWAMLESPTGQPEEQYEYPGEIPPSAPMPLRPPTQEYGPVPQMRPSKPMGDMDAMMMPPMPPQANPGLDAFLEDPEQQFRRRR